MAKSRYSNTDLIGGSGEPLHYASFDLPESLQGLAPPDLLSGITTRAYTWKAGDRIDHLSARFFGDDQYWWIIAIMNGITYPLGIAPGTQLQVPTDVTPVLQRLGLA